MSWEMHLSGALIGIVMALVLGKIIDRPAESSATTGRYEEIVESEDEDFERPWHSNRWP